MNDYKNQRHLRIGAECVCMRVSLYFARLSISVSFRLHETTCVCIHTFEITCGLLDVQLSVTTNNALKAVSNIGFGS